MAIAFGRPTPSRAATPDGWRLAVAGEPVPAARPERRDAVMIVDLVAVGPKVGLTVSRGAAGAVIVHGRGWREWTAAPGLRRTARVRKSRSNPSSGVLRRTGVVGAPGSPRRSASPSN